VGSVSLLAQQVDDELRARLEPLGWTLDEHARLGETTRPDLLARDPEGRYYVIEYRFDSPSPLHFGRLVQVDLYRKLAQATLNTANRVRAVLLYSGEAEPAVLEDARSLDVELIPVDTTDPDAAARALEAGLRGGRAEAGDVGSGEAFSG
jgi:hypothetical protein